MKKYFFASIILVIATVAFVGVEVALAACEKSSSSSGGEVYVYNGFEFTVEAECKEAMSNPFFQKLPTTGPSTISSLLAKIGTIGNILFAVFMSIGLLFLIWGAMQFVIGGPTKVGEARDRMMWGAVGIGFALLAAFFDDIMKSLLSIS